VVWGRERTGQDGELGLVAATYVTNHKMGNIKTQLGAVARDTRSKLHILNK